MSAEPSSMELLPVKGVRIGTAKAGIKYPDRTDVVLFELSEHSTVAGMFTRNRFCAAPVQVARSHLSQAASRYWVINTGNANAGTGEQGFNNALRICAVLSEQAHCVMEAVLPFSTGVIGEPLPMAKLEAALPHALADLDEAHWAQAARGIMTTDTRPKGVSKQIVLSGKTVTLTGISKGAGMIKPNMATMLAFVASDVAVNQVLLQKLHKEAVEQSFNRITVDGDTSTNDCCLLAATGESGVVVSEQHPQNLSEFKQALTELYLQLAHAIVLDAEGATKFITISINGGRSEQECLEVAYTIAHSPLVKTAFFASDPNWGRILAAIGRAPGLDDLDVTTVAIFLDEVCIVSQGGLHSAYTEAQGRSVMARSAITIRVELVRGAANATVWTSDLSHEYVRINAEYRS
ncbi:MAG TPA: bifunctional glutamate N-acetyltransferase/amino-acid acetyltransferase ArgJ [Pseudomonadales bacterium]|nr:bifunctional glutamate N-acetyltransferase/amino-acid acetyltransferase ArgJ [Pseudomonadales bacterium]